MLVAFLLLRAGLEGPYYWFTGEERPVHEQPIDPAVLFNQALDSLFIDYDQELLAQIHPASDGFPEIAKHHSWR